MIALSHAENNLQIPLFHLIVNDDHILLNDTETHWFGILRNLPWKHYRTLGAQYYDALYEFNLNAAEKRHYDTSDSTEHTETQEEAQERLLFGRITMNDVKKTSSAILHQAIEQELVPTNTNPMEIAPGIVPQRLAGKTPKCFFALLKSFIGISLMGFPPEPEMVYTMLKSNPSFARACGFVPYDADEGYSYHHIPSLRKLEQFDQIMTSYNLWDTIKWNEVRRSIKDGLIQKEAELVADTTHYYAYSSFETVEYTNEKGTGEKKSQSKVTKNCRCADWHTCIHPWQLADDGAGTVVKSNNTMHWAHKASIIGYPKQGIPLDARAVSDAATHDSKTVFPHVEKVFTELPEIKENIKRILYDSACDDRELKEIFKEELNIDLKASLNIRRKKAIIDDLPRGIVKITPSGIPLCQAEHEMEYMGMRLQDEKFIYQAPRDVDNTSVCLQCPYKETCCPRATQGRMITVSFDTLPNINPDDPPMAKRFKAIMSRRPAVERMIKRLKCDLSDDRLSKRGNASFQAYLDKTMIAFHMLLRF
jgi:hypothetical protein